MNIGILLALSAAAFFSAANMIDAQLTQRNFKTKGVLVFYSCVLNLAFTLPVLLHPQFALPHGQWTLLFVSSQLHLLSYYMLYHALQRFDTSVVTCLMTLVLSLVPVFSAVTGYEALSSRQWFGFTLCVASAIGLSWTKSASKTAKQGIVFAILCGLVFCVIAVVDDRLSNDLHWSTQYAGIQILMLVTMGLCLARGAFRRQVMADRTVFKKAWRGFAASETAFALGTILIINAFKNAQVGAVEAIIASMPAMIFAASFVLPNKWTNDDTSRKVLPRKLLCFAVTIFGIYLLY